MVTVDKSNLLAAAVVLQSAVLLIANADKFTADDIANARKVIEQLGTSVLNQLGITLPHW